MLFKRETFHLNTTIEPTIIIYSSIHAICWGFSRWSSKVFWISDLTEASVLAEVVLDVSLPRQPESSY